jgi:branched-chain amino acid transport system ATP-binding protein
VRVRFGRRVDRGRIDQPTDGASQASNDARMTAALLEVTALQTAYGSSQVLFGIDLAIAAGEAVGLLGRNGMGKTTLVKTICGLVPSRAGTVSFRGVPVTGRPADRIARMGLALVPEGRQVFPNLSVLEHLEAFAACRNGSSDPWTTKRVFELFPRLAERRRNLGSQLSGGEQQMLAIGRALVTNPHLLILDEATEGLAPLVREEIWRCLRRLRADGQTILVVDKYVNRLIEIADRHVIVERGRVAWQGTSAELDADRSLWQRFLGV